MNMWCDLDPFRLDTLGWKWILSGTLWCMTARMYARVLMDSVTWESSRPFLKHTLDGGCWLCNTFSERWAGTVMSALAQCSKQPDDVTWATAKWTMCWSEIWKSEKQASNKPFVGEGNHLGICRRETQPDSNNRWLNAPVSILIFSFAVKVSLSQTLHSCRNSLPWTTFVW